MFIFQTMAAPALQNSEQARKNLAAEIAKDLNVEQGTKDYLSVKIAGNLNFFEGDIFTLKINENQREEIRRDLKDSLKKENLQAVAGEGNPVRLEDMERAAAKAMLSIVEKHPGWVESQGTTKADWDLMFSSAGIGEDFKAKLRSLIGYDNLASGVGEPAVKDTTVSDTTVAGTTQASDTAAAAELHIQPDTVISKQGDLAEEPKFKELVETFPAGAREGVENYLGGCPQS